MTTFTTSETGAVTVDWVVLTAALVGLGLATMGVVSSGVEDTSGDISSELSRSDIVATGFRTGNAVEYGLYGFSVVVQAQMDNAAASYAGLSAAELQTAYSERAALLEASVHVNGANSGLVGKGVKRQYHDLGFIAQELQSLGEPLPDGAIRPNEAGDMIRLYEPCFGPGTYSPGCP